MPLKPLLIVEEGPDKGRQFATEAVMFRVGRSEDECDFVLSDEDSAISREHFAVIRRGDAFLFNNLSRNGSTINGVKTEQTLLKDNDLIRVGQQTVIRFSLQEQRDSNVNPNFG
jgi:predicted component of type VI protein secretion system